MKTRIIQTPTGQRLTFWCPGCDNWHQIGIAGAEPVWQWDGDKDHPTVFPSIRVDQNWPEEDGGPRVCHSFLRAGMLEFLNDCTHPLAGQTVALPDLPA